MGLQMGFQSYRVEVRRHVFPYGVDKKTFLLNGESDFTFLPEICRTFLIPFLPPLTLSLFTPWKHSLFSKQPNTIEPCDENPPPPDHSFQGTYAPRFLDGADYFGNGSPVITIQAFSF